MDSFGVHNVKSEKTNAIYKYRSFQRVNVTFRILEICVFLIIISRFTAHLLEALKLYGDYFRGLSVTAVSPFFVFFIGNTIVIVLFLKSRQTKDGTADHTSIYIPITDLHDDYAMNYEKNQHQRGESVIRSDVASCTVKEKKLISRSRSEIFKNVNNHHHKESCRELRRSVTERRVELDEEKRKGWVPENEMSNEEFRRTIEAFIARQQRVLREEDDFSSAGSFI